MQQWIIVGHGMAAMRLLQDLMLLARWDAQITVIGEESWQGYNRIGLSDVLAGVRELESLATVAPDWFEKHGVSCVHDWVCRIDRKARHVMLKSGERLRYDRLILATGSSPRLPDVPGIDLPGVRPFRTVADVEQLLSVPAGARALVLGGGLLGLEAATGLAGRGVDVTVVHRDDWLMNRQLDSFAAGWLEEALRQQGIAVRTGEEVEAISARENGGLHAVLKSGEALQASAVVPAIGIMPRIELARECGLSVDRGIQVDDQLRTSDPCIHALGECAEHRGVSYGLVAPLYEQAHQLAAHLGGLPAAYQGSAVSTQLKVSGLPVFSAGVTEGETGDHVIVWQDESHREYRKLVIRSGCLIGAVLFGDIRDGSFYHDLIERAADITSVRESLVFGAAFCGAQPSDSLQNTEKDTENNRAAA
ncbi:MAG: FAD-dependent oxidoreductase [Natronospirillum sp.]|uniref:NAD(P)/FAD-dependent oxidoreductase n=1 Tax=Natronospirillum sp. TaxID=2812955 RepID=UPI0025F493A4|nr:FAD-dependent oxidoreductase [Natronospirillum sp.]MCH8550635.1 FAD-dependent oxidoreductase [Natronospirillum sp.]